MDSYEANLIYGVAWISFGLIHSLFAATKIKDTLEPLLNGYYRLSYNLLALSHIVIIWFIGSHVFNKINFIMLPIYIEIILNIISIFGLILLVISLKNYNLGLFSGASQIRFYKLNKNKINNEPLKRIGLNAYIRHPLYLSLYIILWSQASNAFGLSTAIWGSIYLAIGTFFEERRLLLMYGNSYRDYKIKVPALIPWRGKLH
jgi:protein-S-isoprenylcysteine O-methyltransferase Ste14